MKATRRKLPQILNEEEVKHLIEQPKTDSVLGLRDRAIMSGWETDQSGGGWEEKPSGFFPNDFAFNVDSFCLNDTNTQHAMTIRHQIARQIAGKVTWELRFMLLAAMEGAVWQLRDLDA